MPEESPKRDDPATIVALAILVFAPAIFLHEVGHALVASQVGGDPTLVSSTDMRADLSNVGPWGYVAVGASGSAVNWLLAAAGLLGLRLSSGASPRWGFWVLAAVNGFLPAWYLAVSPAIGFGDWMTVIRRFEPQVPLRVVASVAGLGLTWVWWRVMVAELDRISDVALEDSSVSAVSLLSRARLVWLGGGTLAVLAATLSPLGLGWALPIAVGSTLGTTWPMLPAARAASERLASADRASPAIGRSLPLLIAGGLAALAFVALVGPGIRL